MGELQLVLPDLMGSCFVAESNVSSTVVGVGGFGVSVDPVRVKNEGTRTGKEGREVFDIWKILESTLLPC